jgi:hypothetical protein
MGSRWGIILVAVLGAARAEAATVPKTVNVQGVLRDGVGGLESGSFQFTINVYSALTGGTSLWTQTQASIPVESGFFTLTLATNDTGDKTIADIVEQNASPLFVGVTLQGDASELPRIQLNTVPYAFVADHATSVDNFGGVPASAVSNLFGGAGGSCATGQLATGISSGGTLACAPYAVDGTSVSVNVNHQLTAAVPLTDGTNLHTLAGEAVALNTLAGDATNLHTLAASATTTALTTLASDESSLNALAAAQSCPSGFVSGINASGALTCATAYTGDTTSVSVNAATNVVSLASPVSKAVTFSGAAVSFASAAGSSVAFAGPVSSTGVLTTTAAAGSAVDLSAGTVALPVSTVVQIGTSANPGVATAACPSSSYVAIGGGCSTPSVTVGAGLFVNCPSNGPASATAAAACVSGATPTTTSWSCSMKASGSFVMTAYVICLKQH